MKSIEIRCIGRVQGVFFRASVKVEAERLGIKGWVRNENNGDVLIHALGKDLELKELTQWCETGPQLANVEKVVAAEVEKELFDAFFIKY